MIDSGSPKTVVAEAPIVAPHQDAVAGHDSEWCRTIVIEKAQLVAKLNRLGVARSATPRYLTHPLPSAADPGPMARGQLRKWCLGASVGFTPGRWPGVNSESGVRGRVRGSPRGTAPGSATPGCFARELSRLG